MTERTIAETAAQWFVRLQDASTSPSAFVEWQRWMNAAPENRRAYEDIEELMLRMRSSTAAPPLPTADEMQRDSYDGTVPVDEFLQTPLPGSNARWFALAASITAVAVTASFAWLHLSDAERIDVETYATAAAERREVTLSDGSHVTLDASSQLTVSMSDSQRTLHLDRGEAYFKVEKDASRPFIVHAGGAQVRAIGTAFNVRMSNERTVVAVVEGKVEVTAQRAPDGPRERSRTDSSGGVANIDNPNSVQLIARLNAGEAVEARAQDGKLEVLPTHIAPTATTWIEGRRQYRGEPLRYIVGDISRHTNRSIVIADEATGDLKFTGTLNLDNSEAWLRGLSVALPVTVREAADGTVMVERR